MRHAQRGAKQRFKGVHEQQQLVAPCGRLAFAVAVGCEEDDGELEADFDGEEEGHVVWCHWKRKGGMSAPEGLGSAKKCPLRWDYELTVLLNQRIVVHVDVVVSQLLQDVERAALGLVQPGWPEERKAIDDCQQDCQLRNIHKQLFGASGRVSKEACERVTHRE